MFLSHLFNKTKPTGIQANNIQYKNNKAVVDVRGQTCPGYLLAINKAVTAIEPETEIDLLISYPPCGEDVKAWCKEREIKFLSVDKEEERWVIRIKK